MKLYEILTEENVGWNTAFHVTPTDLTQIDYLSVKTERQTVGASDAIMTNVVPEYHSSIFFHMGAPMALEWDEYADAEFMITYDTSYLLNNFKCVMLKGDHLENRWFHMEYFITDESDRKDYLEMMEPFRRKGMLTTPKYDSHPHLRQWNEQTKRPTEEQMKRFVENELVLRGEEIRQHMNTTKRPFQQELLVQGKIPIADGKIQSV